MLCVNNDSRLGCYQSAVDGVQTENNVAAVVWLNRTSGSVVDGSLEWTVWRSTVIGVTCGLIILGTVVGNLLVCLAVLLVRRLQTPSNLLIVSLAVSDLCVAVAVMPLAAAYEATGHWTLGQSICDLWTSLDVMLCTASILNLCAISVDRYLVITRPLRYAVRRTPKHMALMVLTVWVMSALISIPPLFGWKEQSPDDQCVLSQAIGYQFYATIGAFYLPLTIMIVIYYRIYRVSSRIARSDVTSSVRCHGNHQQQQQQQPLHEQVARHSSTASYDQRGCYLSTATDELAAACVSTNNHQQDDGTMSDTRSAVVHDGTLQLVPTGFKRQLSSRLRFRGRFSRSRLSVRSTLVRERKATRTLGVIMGAFTACWLPFFIVALVKPFIMKQAAAADVGVGGGGGPDDASQSPPDVVPPSLASVFLWLGYANSFLNPLIYARFNREFRGPFRDILLFRCRGIDARERYERYAEQYGDAGRTGNGSCTLHPARSTSSSALHHPPVHGGNNGSCCLRPAAGSVHSCTLHPAGSICREPSSRHHANTTL